MNNDSETSKFQNGTIAPMHTAEHLLNRTMVNIFGCSRSRNAHIERKKSKISFDLRECPTDEMVADVCRRMNDLIAADLPVTAELCSRDNLPADVSLERMPDDCDEAAPVRLVRIGDYDVCPCIGLHVTHTAQLGRFVLLGTNWNPEAHSFRLRFKLEGATFAE